jgi:hypothetical protein
MRKWSSFSTKPFLDITRMGLLWNSANPGSSFYLDAVEHAARSLNITQGI